jgi:hypothetical protein
VKQLVSMRVIAVPLCDDVVAPSTFSDPRHRHIKASALNMCQVAKWELYCFLRSTKHEVGS